MNFWCLGTSTGNGYKNLGMAIQLRSLMSCSSIQDATTLLCLPLSMAVHYRFRVSRAASP